MNCSHDESDMSIRLVEVWYDTLWGLFMSNSVDHVAKRMNHRRKLNSSSASVASTIVQGSVVGKGVTEKLRVLEYQLKNIRKYMKARQFEDICKVALKSNDELYPGFKDILLVAQYLLHHADAYKNTLTNEEIRGLTLTLVFQEIFYQLCNFLLTSQAGKEASKLIIAPCKITNAAYDICRQKFCRLVCDETSIVQYGLFEVVKKTIQDRESDPEGVIEETSSNASTGKPLEESVDDAPPVENEDESVHEVTDDVKAEQPETVDLSVEEEAVESVQEAVPKEPPPEDQVSVMSASASASVSASISASTRTTGSRRPSLASVPFLTPTLDRNTRILKFPVIDLSSDSENGDGDESSVSSLEDEEETFLVHNK